MYLESEPSEAVQFLLIPPRSLCYLSQATVLNFHFFRCQRRRLTGTKWCGALSELTRQFDGSLGTSIPQTHSYAIGRGNHWQFNKCHFPCRAGSVSTHVFDTLQAGKHERRQSYQNVTNDWNHEPHIHPHDKVTSPRNLQISTMGMGTCVPLVWCVHWQRYTQTVFSWFPAGTALVPLHICTEPVQNERI
jgi:hypothetical protein